MGRGFHVCETCGRSIRRARPGKIAWELRSEAKQAAALVSPNPILRAEALDVLPQPFRDWEPGDVFVAAVELGLVVCFPDRAAHAKVSKRVSLGEFSDFTVTHLVEGYRMVRYWPESFHALLSRVVTEHAHGTIQSLGPLSKFFHVGPGARLITRLIREEVTSVLPKLDLIPLGGSSVRLKWMKRDDRVSCKAIMSRFGLDFKTVRRLNESGNAVTRLGTKKKRYFYNPHMLASSVAIYRASLNAHECADLLAMPDYCIDAICQRGLLKAVSDNDAALIANSVRYGKESLEALLGRLRSLPLHDVKGRKLSECLERQFHPETWADALEALLCGDLRIAGHNCDLSFCLNKITVSTEDFEQLIAVMPNRALPTDVIISCTTAGVLLGVASAIMGHAVRSGLLVGKFPKVAGEVRLTDLAEFSQQYMLGGEGDFRLGYIRAFSARMNAAGYRPAAVLRRHLIWKRCDAEEFLGNTNCAGVAS
jgi:hypothetical protein